MAVLKYYLDRVRNEIGGRIMPELSYYSVIIFITWLTLLVMTVLVQENDRLDKQNKRLFYIVYFIIGVSSLCEWTGVFLSGNLNFPSWMLQAVKTGDYILTPCAAIVVVAQTRKIKAFTYTVAALLTANAIFQIVTAFTGGMIKIDEFNRYSHGPLYPIYMVFYSVLIILFITGFVIYSKDFRKRNRTSLYAIMIFIVLGIILQEFTSSDIRTAYLVLAISMPFLFIHFNEFSQMRIDDEIKHKDYEIMVSQIKPHFLFNSLSVIRELYEEDVEAGDHALTDFSQFLRYNLDSLSKERMISFSEEMENIKRYLELQQLRFGDSLKVTYDLESIDFKVPVFSIQPIVENAVAHGARKRADKQGHVTISSKEYPDHYEIKIVDNGPGFVPEDVEKETTNGHIGIKNVCERLDLAENGDLIIDSKLGEGTTATLIFPKGA